MALFDVPDTRSKDYASLILNKSKKTSKSSTGIKSGGGLITKITNICSLVQQRLGHYSNDLM